MKDVNLCFYLQFESHLEWSSVLICDPIVHILVTGEPKASEENLQ